jgi:hypothetical protein
MRSGNEQSSEVKTFRHLALYLLPVLFLFCLYYDTVHIWFRESDFALLTLSREVRSYHDLLIAMFTPYAQ